MRLKRMLIFIMVCAIICVSSVCSTLPIQAAGDVTVKLSTEKQVIRGFGGMNHPVWIDDLTSSQCETAFGNGDGQLGFSILRIHVDPNKENWSKELPTAKSAVEHGAIVFASPWNPPSNMTERFNHNGNSNAKRLKHDKYDEYAQHLNDFVSYMKENGVDLYAISVQNEPDYADEWTWWTPQEILTFMKENAGDINCRVIAPESFQYRKNISDPILNDPQALANLDILGAHLYGTQLNQFSYPLFKQKGAGKDLWMTEVYHPNSSSQADKWPEALETALNVHNSMVEAEFQAYVWWFIRRYYSPMKEDGTMSKRGAMMAHYSKYVRPDYVRVDATKNPNSNVYVSAYKGDDKVVVVAINKGYNAVNQKFNIQGGTPLKVSNWVTTGSKNLSEGLPINVSGGSFAAELPAQSVTTFVGELKTAPTPTIAPTPTPDKVIVGDVNGDKDVNSIDFGYFRQYLLGMISDFHVEDDLKAADLDGNGSINSIDFGYFRQYLLGVIDKFPAS